MIMTNRWYQISALNDELALTFEEQLDVLAAHEIEAVELRNVLGQNVLDLDAADVETVRARLRERGVRVTCIASPIGKAKLDEPRSALMEQTDRALRLAEMFGSPSVRIFSYYVEPGEIEATRDEVIARLGGMARLAEQRGRLLLHENERGIWGATPDRCRDLIETIASPALRAIFDPGNFVGEGLRPFDEAYPLLAAHIAHVHIKDARRDPASGRTRSVPAGQGDGQLPALLAELQRRGWRGVLALEPHLAEGGPRGGYTGPALFAEAVAALRASLPA